MLRHLNCQNSAANGPQGPRHLRFSALEIPAKSHTEHGTQDRKQVERPVFVVKLLDVAAMTPSQRVLCAEIDGTVL